MDDGLCGISPGGLPLPTPVAGVGTNLDAAFAPGVRFLVNPGAAKFQRFFQNDVMVTIPEKMDLMTICDSTARITFVPDGAGGYTAFAGTR
jgi:hypothetical protein